MKQGPRRCRGGMEGLNEVDEKSEFPKKSLLPPGKILTVPLICSMSFFYLD